MPISRYKYESNSDSRLRHSGSCFQIPVWFVAELSSHEVCVRFLFAGERRHGGINDRIGNRTSALRPLGPVSGSRGRRAPQGVDVSSIDTREDSEWDVR